jgi:hypothetical protein
METSMPLIKPIIKNQHHAAPAMLGQAIDRCPETLRISNDHPNRFWQVAYHALFCTHRCLHRDEAAFRPWGQHREEYQFLGSLPWPPNRPPKIGESYTKAQVSQYYHLCKNTIGPLGEKLNLDAPEIGFR